MPNPIKLIASLLIFTIFMTGCTLGPVFGGDIPIGPKGIIYEEDDRLDFYEIYDLEIQKQAKACPALMHSNRLVKQADGSYNIKPYMQSDGSMWTYGERYDFEEVVQRFKNQPMASSCSAFLVAPNIVITAGHCIDGKTEDQLSGIRFVFGYWMESSSDAKLNVPEENVYSIGKVIHSEYSKLNAIDYAIIELDRDVTVAEPLKISEKEVKVGDQVYIIGYPNGLPLKYAPNAEVYRVNQQSFVASLDAFKGNSGSPVFNSEGEIVGVYITTYLIIIGTDYYGRWKKHGYAPADLSGNRSTHSEYFDQHVPE